MTTPYSRHIPDLYELPPKLADLPIWCAWQLIHKPNKKPDKVPVSANPMMLGGKAWSKPDFCATAAQAIRYATANTKLQGIGIILRDESGLAGGDVDGCIDLETGVISDEAQQIITQADTYTEISPGLAGIRFVAFGSFGGHTGHDSSKGVELYESRRFLTITGRHYPGTPTDIEHRDLTELGRAYFGKDEKQPPQEPADIEPPIYWEDGSSATAGGYTLAEIRPWLRNNGADYDTWMRVGAALKSAGGTYLDWVDYSRQSEKHDERDMPKKWASFTDKANGVGIGTLAKMALDAGMPSREDQRRHETVQAFTDTAPLPEPVKTAAVDLLNPPGLAGDICRYIDMMARRPRPELYPFAAMHLMALVGSKRSSVYTEKLNLTTLAIAPTAAGKEVAQDAIKRLANLVYCSKYIHGNAGSFKDLIYNLLEGDGASLYTVDEVHSFLGSMNHKNAATYETKMEAEILTMSTTQLYTFRGSEKRHLIKAYKDDLKSLEKVLEGKDDDSEETKKLRRIAEQTRNRIEWLENGLPNPFFSLMGHSVPERMDSFIKLENIDSGFIGRALIMRCPESREKLRRKIPRNGEEAFLEESIIEALTRIKRGGLIIDAADDAADYLDAAVDWYDADEQRNHPVVGGIYARAPEHLFRVATILALSRGTIELEHAKYAHAMVQQSIEDIRHIMLKAYADSAGAQEAQVREHARQVIHRNAKGGGMTLSRLRQFVEKPKGWQEMKRKDVKRDHFVELIELMISRGELVKDGTGRRERYKSMAAR